MIAAAPEPKGSGGAVVEGAYECWSNGQARMIFNFTIRAVSQYTDAEGHAGSFKFAPSNSRIRFIGGNLSDLGKDYVIIYHEPAGHG